MPPILPSELSNTSSTEALPTGLRAAEPLKTTSAMFSPRRCLAESSPMTQRTASITFDLPQPFGPTTPVRLLGKLTWVGSTKDLKPASLILVNRILEGHPTRKKECRSIEAGPELVSRFFIRRAAPATRTGFAPNPVEPKRAAHEPMPSTPTTELETFPNPSPE